MNDVKKKNDETHLKGIAKSDYIDRDELEPVKDFSIPQLKRHFKGYSEYKIKKSLLRYGWFKGTTHVSVCQSCSETFQSIFKDMKFCSNHCKHMSQNIWNRGTTKENNKWAQISSERMSRDNPNRFVNYSKKQQEVIFLPNLKMEITYDKKSNLEKDWLLQLDTSPGIVSISKPSMEIIYESADFKYRRYHPDFCVEWESGIKWLVEVKGVVRYNDIHKFKSAMKWCMENGYVYKLITTGDVKRETWDETFSILPEIVPFSQVGIMLEHAFCAAKFSLSKKRKVGCSIWTHDFFPLSFGYNSNVLSDQETPKNFSSGDDGFLHAEESALISLQTEEDNLQMAITHAPCAQCAKRIILSKKIKTVYYTIPYKDMSGVGELIKNGIKVYKFELVDGSGVLLPYDKVVELLTPPG